MEKAQVEGLSKPKIKIMVWRESTSNERSGMQKTLGWLHKIFQEG